MSALIFLLKQAASPPPPIDRLPSVPRAHASSPLLSKPASFSRFGSLLALFIASLGIACAAESAAGASFHQKVEPILAKYCYDCHGNGIEKGRVSFDELTDAEVLAKRDLWLAALKN